VSYLSTSFAALSDVVPSAYRAPTYGLLLSGYFGGFSFAPSMAILVSSDTGVALFSFCSSIAAVLAAVWFIPETLPDPVQIEQITDLPVTDDHDPIDLEPIERNEDADLLSSEYEGWRSKFTWIGRNATRPLREISILRRNRTLQLVSLGSFCAAMVFAIDATLVIYYIEETLDIQKADIAMMSLAMGIAGILIQGGLVQPIVARLGEQGALTLAYSCGTVHNFLYGSAQSKSTIYAALILSQLTKTNIPILSSIASREVAPDEQGRVQGALFAVNAVGNAVGPILVQSFFHHSGAKFGRGSMFIYASAIYAIGTIVVSFIPNRLQGVSPPLVVQLHEPENMEEPLLCPNERTDSVDDGSSEVL
jgi:predicted MFS family arabinose efflux permease